MVQKKQDAEGHSNARAMDPVHHRTPAPLQFQMNFWTLKEAKVNPVEERAAWDKSTKQPQQEVRVLKAAQDKPEQSAEQWGKIADQNFGLLPPLVISKSGLVHDKMRQPVASPLCTWHSLWLALRFVFVYLWLRKDKVTCQKCTTLSLALSKEVELCKAGG